MGIEIGTNSWRAAENRANGGAAGKMNASGSSEDVSGRSSGPADVADISETAKSLNEGARAMSAASATGSTRMVIDGSAFSVGQSTRGQIAGASGLGLKRYLGVNGETGDTGLAAMNSSRKNLGDRIDSLVKSAGVTLGRDEKITVSVDGQDRITVGGVKSQAKREAIEKALNGDRRLARDLKTHVANGKISDAAKKQAAYEKEFGAEAAQMGQNLDDMFTDRSVRTFVIDEYLRANAGMSVADIQYERDKDGNVSFVGLPEEVRVLFAEDEELAKTVANMLENGETGSTFKVSFEFANGAISDSTTDNAARDKIEEIKAMIMGGVDEEGNIYPGMIDDAREMLERHGVDPEDPEYKQFMAYLSRGFSIQVKKNGEFEIMGVEDMDENLVRTLEGIVNQALREYSKRQSSVEAGSDRRVGNFADVAEAFIEQHRFEHGDVDEFEHAVEIDFAGGRNAVKVVSPEADKAQEAENQATADKLGQQLRGMLEDEGVEVDGLEIEIDDSGKITVFGNPDDPNVKKAQQLLDQFALDARQADEPENRDDVQAEKDAKNEAREMRGSKGNEYADVRNTEWRMSKLAEIAPFLPGTGNSYQDLHRANLYLGWQTILPKNDNGTTFLSSVDRVSSVKERRFDGLGGAAEGEYASDAKGLYRKLLDGMGQFHDDRRDVRYRVAL